VLSADDVCARNSRTASESDLHNLIITKREDDFNGLEWFRTK